MIRVGALISPGLGSHRKSTIFLFTDLWDLTHDSIAGAAARFPSKIKSAERRSISTKADQHYLHCCCCCEGYHCLSAPLVFSNVLPTPTIIIMSESLSVGQQILNQRLLAEHCLTEEEAQELYASVAEYCDNEQGESSSLADTLASCNAQLQYLGLEIVAVNLPNHQR